MPRNGRTKASRGRSPGVKKEADYRHPEADAPLRPEVGTQAQFRKKKPPTTYRYDSSLSPALDWDGQNSAREQGESTIRQILEADTIESAKTAAEKLKRLSRPFLNWAGKAERLSFNVPTLPLFVHERLSTKAIIETLKSHQKQAAQTNMFDLFGDPKRSVADQVLRAYEYKDKWVNRLILGDSLLVMNSLLNYEGLGGQVQMIYIDPPYGVKFGSNFQPFVRKRDVSPSDDEDMTREPEMVKAYRDTWELGLHSYLTYLRDRLLLARDLLHPSGSVFVQISDENLHHVREVVDEVFGPDNHVSVIVFKKTTSATSEFLPTVNDYVLWYARDISRLKYRQLFHTKGLDDDVSGVYRYVRLASGSERRLTDEELAFPERIPVGSKIFRLDNLTSQRPPGDFPVTFDGATYRPGRGYWKTSEAGMRRLIAVGRIAKSGSSLAYKRFIEDFPAQAIGNLWTDTGTGSFTETKLYAVQTSIKIPQRCILMTTDPGDLVLDPTCGSGTTAYAAETWGRRWITIDTSRVPLALTRQRLLTATLPYYELKEESRGPAGGFVYQRRQNRKGDEAGGIVPHVTLKSIANNEPPQEEVLVDRPEIDDHFVRVTGPFAVEATIPSPIELDEERSGGVPAEEPNYVDYVERMLEVLRKSPILQVSGGKKVTLRDIRSPVKSLALSAEAMVENGNGKHGALQAAVDAAHEINTEGLRFSGRPVAIVFGPENGAVSEKLVFEAAREAHAKNFTHLYVVGFAIQANARGLVETCEHVVGVAATYVQATPDLMMGGLLKTTRSSQIFSVCGMPEVVIRRLKPGKNGEAIRYEIELLGYDVFDPTTMELDHRKGDDIPAWMLDTDYNGLVFHGAQVFFPRTSAWENLKKALKATHEETVWDHLAGTVSASFEAGEHSQIAVKVIDDRGNELLVVKSLKEATSA